MSVKVVAMENDIAYDVGVWGANRSTKENWSANEIGRLPALSVDSFNIKPMANETTLNICDIKAPKSPPLQGNRFHRLSQRW